jgi:aryl-alcohol dehydrogenase-like predicted oxidoreductase
MALRRRRLGKTGLHVTEMGFGGIPIQRVTEDVAVAVVSRCRELGMNFFDTARNYTTSEERIGKALERHRKDVILATKTQAKSREGLRQDIETSLKNLHTD